MASIKIFIKLATIEMMAFYMGAINILYEMAVFQIFDALYNKMYKSAGFYVMKVTLWSFLSDKNEWHEI